MSSITSCHSDATAHSSLPPDAPVVALLGAPNVGKSTLFNALTGARRSTGNWPGTTVAVGRSTTTVDGRTCSLLDLPGAFSLDPVSPDEALTRILISEVPEQERPDAVVVVVDGSALSRSLYLVSQVRELPLRCVVVVTMLDVARSHGTEIDATALGTALGVEVLLVDPRHRGAAVTVREALGRALQGPAPAPRTMPGPCCAGAGSERQDAPPDLEEDEDLRAADDRFTWIEACVAAGARRQASDRPTRSDAVDRFLLAPVLGPVLFLAVMWLVFQITTTVAAPLQDLLGGWIDGPVTSLVVAGLQAAHLSGGVVEGFVVDGLLAGVGMLLTFLPLMALMFLLLALLEDSGYMARAAVVTDRTMRLIGLPGRAFLPLIVGFGCNVPAVSGTRVLPDSRQRLLTALLVPLTSCSARLPVYIILADTFFPRYAGTVVFLMYLASILAIVLVGRLLRSTLLRSVPREPLVIDLPAYHVPMPRLVLASVWDRVKGFVQTASGIIVVTVTVVWVLQVIPADGSGTFGDVEVSHSVFAAVSQVLAPLFAPAGFGEWHTVGALFVGFVAKEAVVSSWAQTYAIEESATTDLGNQIMTAFDAASGGHGAVAAVAFMVFVLIYTPCVATLAAQWREIGRRWTAISVGVDLCVAWVLSVLVFQIGRVFW